MKHIKFFLLLAVATLFAACSSDDESINSNASTTVGFTTDKLVMKENSGIFKVPIAINGQRNGDIKMNIQVIAEGSNPATEDTHFLVTSKNLTLLNDTTSAETLGVEIKTVDDNEINEARTFKLKITNLQGAKLERDEIEVVLRDNDAAFFEKFFGKWLFQAVNSDGAAFEKTITISGPSDEEDPNYNNLLTATGVGFLNVGVALDFQWHFRYSFDSATKKGTLGFVMNEIISEYGGSYQWIWLTDDGANMSTEDLTAEWQLGDGDSFPTEITWESTFDGSGVGSLWFYQPGAVWWERFTSIKLVKQQ